VFIFKQCLGYHSSQLLHATENTVFDHVHALLHIWQGYVGARGPVFGWQSFAFNSTSINITTDTDGSILDMSTMGPPLTTSSPKNKSKQQARNKITKRSLRLLIINFQSIKSKKENFWNMLEQRCQYFQVLRKFVCSYSSSVCDTIARNCYMQPRIQFLTMYMLYHQKTNPNNRKEIKLPKGVYDC
jgi:hypothetical protein